MKEISYTTYGQLIFPDDNKPKDSIKLLDLKKIGLEEKYSTPNFLNTQNYVIGKKIISVDNGFFYYKNDFYKGTLLEDISTSIKLEEKKEKIGSNLKIIEVEKDFYFYALKNYKQEEGETQQMLILLIMGFFVLLFALSLTTDIYDAMAVLIFMIFVVRMILRIIYDVKHDYYVLRISPNKILLIKK